MENKFKCKYCNLEFESKYKLAGHSTHCKKNPNYELNKINCNNFKLKNRTKQLIISSICPFCNNEISSTKSGITFHINRCKENPNRKIHPGNHGHTVGYTAWNKGLTANDNEIIKKMKNNRHENYVNKKWNQNWHKWTDEEKENLRIKSILYITSLKGEFKCRYSKKACNYIDELNKKNNWNLQHAENGGEICLYGYFLDGYDKNLNIIFEYDEYHHYEDVYNNILCKKDIDRQNYLISKLDCEFWRYNENKDLLYRVH